MSSKLSVDTILGPTTLGLGLTSNSSINIDGSGLNIVGVCTGTFSGDGSALTNISVYSKTRSIALSLGVH